LALADAGLVDLAAAVVVTSAALARAGAVHPLALTACKEQGPPSVRPSIGSAPALDLPVSRALELAAVDPAAISRFDLSSCFPSAVQLEARAFGLADDDPRPRTVTGGLPYFGGPGASYSLHGVVSMVEELRADPDPDAVGAVVGIGGRVDDFSVGLYSLARADGPCAIADLGTADHEPVPEQREGSGRAVVDAMTVLHDRDQGPVAAPVIARFADGSRIGVRAGDPSLAAELSGTSLVGREIVVSTDEGRATYVPA
jgi:acetyl-CoA C-acetyltransferase